METRNVFVVSNNEQVIYHIVYSWRVDYLLDKLIFSNYKFNAKQDTVATVIYYNTSLLRARQLWHKVVGWELVDGVSVPKYIHEIQARNIEPQYVKYNKRAKPIDLRYFQLLEGVDTTNIEFFRRLTIT